MRFMERADSRSSLSMASIEEGTICRAPTSWRLVAEGFAGFEGVGDAGLGEFFAAERDERFPFEVEDVLFADELGRSERAAGKNVGEFAGDDGVVIGGVAAADEHVDQKFCRGEELIAEDFDLGGLSAFLPGSGGGLPTGAIEGQSSFLGVSHETLRIHRVKILAAEIAEV